MLPYSAVAAIDYAAYQSRPHYHGLSSSSSSANVVGNIGSAAAAAAAFTHSWLVSSSPSTSIDAQNEEFAFGVANNSNKIQFQQAPVDSGHV